MEIARDLKPVMDRLAHYKLPIQFPTAWSQFQGQLYYGNPEWVDEVAGRYPEVPIILTKMGRSINFYFDMALTVARRNVNVYFDIVGTCGDHLRRAVDILGPDRIMFGSDWSATWRWLQPDHIYTARLKVLDQAGLSPADRETVCWKTANRVFKLDVERSS